MSESSLTVLVAEDISANRLVAGHMLKHLGYTAVDYVEDGQQAIDACQDKSYDVILMDVQMPVKDGLEATMEIIAQADVRRPPVVVGVTAHALDAHKVECLKAGMTYHLSKPIVMDELKEIMLQCESIQGVS